MAFLDDAFHNLQSALGIPTDTQQATTAEQPTEAPDDTKVIQSWEDRWKQADRAQRGIQKIWKENISMIWGIQWLQSTPDGLGTINVAGHTAPGRERMTDNRIFAAVRRLHARLDQVKYEPLVVAVTDDPGDHAAARAASGVLRNFYHQERVTSQNRQALWWVIATGQAFLELFFDPQLGNMVPQPKTDENGDLVYEPALDERGQPIVDQTPIPNPQTGMVSLQPHPRQRPAIELVPQGRVSFVVRSPFNVRLDPRQQEWERLRWIIIEETVAREEVLDRFSDSYKERTGSALDDDLPRGERVKTQPFVPELSPNTTDYVGLTKPAPEVTDVVCLRRCYERPSEKFPDGRQIIFAKGMNKFVLYRGGLGTPDLDFPVVKLSYLAFPWLIWSKSPVEGAVQLQRSYNTILSRYAEHLRRLPAGWMLIPITSGIKRRSFTNEAGGMVWYNPAGGKPEFVFPPLQNLAVYERYLQLLLGSLEEQMALPPASRGQMPRGAKAAKMVEMLQEQADAIQQPVLSDLSDQWSLFFTKALAMMDDRYNDQRMVGIIGDDKRPDVVEFKSGTLPKEWRERLTVKVEAGESLPGSRVGRIQFILTLARQYGMFGQPGSPEFVQRLRRVLDLDAGFIDTPTDLDTAQADKENIEIVHGKQQVQIGPFDDDRVHLDNHVMFWKRFGVAGRETEAQSLLPHIQAHQQRLAQKVQQAQQLAAQHPQLPGSQKSKPPRQPRASGGPAGAQVPQ